MKTNMFKKLVRKTHFVEVSTNLKTNVCQAFIRKDAFEVHVYIKCINIIFLCGLSISFIYYIFVT